MHPTEKVFSRVEALSLVCEDVRANGQRLVLTTVVCDILHTGHSEYMYKARQQGDFLVVGVDSDAMVRRVKGPDRPHRAQDERAKFLAYFDFIDALVVYDDEPALLRAVHPHVVVVSTTSHVRIEDDPPRLAVVQELGIEICEFGSTVDLHTTTILEKMRKEGGG